LEAIGDHRLTGAVVAKRLLADHLPGIAGGIVHRAHLRAVERGVVLEQRPENLHRNVARQDVGEDLLLVGLVVVDHAARIIGGSGLEHRRNDLLRGLNLRYHRLEAGEEQRADIERALGVEPQDAVRDLLRVHKFDGAERPQLDVLDDHRLELPPQHLVALAPDAEELDLLALRDERVGALAREPHDRRVEGAAQAALGGAHQQEMHAVAAGAAQQRRRGIAARHGGGDMAEHLVHALRIGPSGFGRHLRAAQLGGRHHLHGLGDLLRRLG
jgi:hypothetical protein